MSKEEKLARIEECEKKLRKLEKKGYKITAELKALKAFDRDLAPGYAEDAFERFVHWADDALDTSRRWALKED